MKVLMIGSHLQVKGGITQVVKNYYQAGIGEKVDLSYYPTYYGKSLPINILYFTLRVINLFIQLFLFSRVYDVAHIHMSYKGSFTRKRIIINILARKKIPIVLHMHGSSFKDYYKESSKGKQKQISDTLNKARIIVALGISWKNYFESISSTKVISLDNAVFPKKHETILNEKMYITTMGVLSKRKGTYDIIEVAKKLRGKIDEKYKFLIAGDGDIEKVKKLIELNGLSDMFLIPGWISDSEEIERIYRKSVIYILPSYNEGMPMSILEAMSYGIPIISTNVGSIAAVVEKENGYVVNPGDIESIESCIQQLLKNEEKNEIMGRNNIEKITKNYNIYRSVEDLITIYKNISGVKNIAS